MDARLNGRFWLLLWLLLLTTFGLGTLGLWAWSLRWPRTIDAEGIRLRSGRQVPWTSIKGLGVVKHHDNTEISRIDIHVDGRTTRVPLKFFENGTTVANEIRSHLPQLRRH